MKELEQDGHIIIEEEKDFGENNEIINYTKAWNKTLPDVFNKSFNINEVSTQGISFENDIFTKFFNCEVKDLFVNNFTIPSPLLGSYLSSFKSVLSDYELVDTRNWYGSTEYPPLYEMIQLNSKKSDDFLVEGIQFYKVAGKNRLTVKFMPGWFGMNVVLVSSSEQKDWNKEVLVKIQKDVKENNLLKGEKLSLSGEFLTKGANVWSDIIVDDKLINSIKLATKILEKKDKSRGLLFVGPAGTGKTLTGKVMLNELDSTFIWISSKDMDKVGPITAIKLAFQLARNLAPAIIFMEDIDNWIGKQATDLLKTELDGIKENKGVVTILTSNYPELLPDALIDRPGRFHEILNFALPTESIRSRMIQEWGGVNSEIALDIAKKLDGFSGAHIKELIEYAKSISEDNDIELNIALEISLDKLNEQRDLIQSLRQTTKGIATNEKSGRIISSKNKAKIVTARDALNEIITISEGIDNTENLPKKMMSDFKIEVPVQTIKKLSEQEILLKTLQSMVKLGNNGLQTRRQIRNVVE